MNDRTCLRLNASSSSQRDDQTPTPRRLSEPRLTKRGNSNYVESLMQDAILFAAGLAVGIAATFWSETRDPHRFNWSVRSIATHIGIATVAIAPAAFTSVEWVDGDGWRRASVVALTPLTALLSNAFPWFSVLGFAVVAVVCLAVWQVAKIFLSDAYPTTSSIRRVAGWITATPQQRAGIVTIVLFLVVGSLSGQPGDIGSGLADGIGFAILGWAGFTRWGIDRLGLRAIIVYVVLSYVAVLIIPNVVFQPSPQYESSIVASPWSRLSIVLIGLAYEVLMEVRKAKIDPSSP